MAEESKKRKQDEDLFPCGSKLRKTVVVDVDEDVRRQVKQLKTAIEAAHNHGYPRCHGKIMG